MTPQPEKCIRCNCDLKINLKKSLREYNNKREIEWPNRKRRVLKDITQKRTLMGGLYEINVQKEIKTQSILPLEISKNAFTGKLCFQC